MVPVINTDIQFYETLRQKLGNQEAAAIVKFVDTKLKTLSDHTLKTLATKEGLRDVEFALKQDLKDVHLELKQDIKEVHLELKQDMADLKLELSVKMSDTKTDIIRWVFAFFIPLLLAIIGLYIKK